MEEKRVLKFNHSNVVSDKKKRKKTSQKVDEGFNEMTKELRNRLITKNKEMSKQNSQQVEHSMTNEINNFDNAIKFLERIREKKRKKEKRKHKSTVKCHTNQFTPNSQENPQTNDPISKLKSEPPCGVLKNGKKPLWRDYHKTRKKKLNLNTDNHNDNLEVIDLNKSIPAALGEEKPKSPAPISPAPISPAPINTSQNVKISPTVIASSVVQTESPTPNVTRPKVVLGKRKKKLGFLLKTKKQKKSSNRYTRKNKLKMAGLIKETTNAPDDILEIMYDSIVNDDDETICKLKENKE